MEKVDITVVVPVYNSEDNVFLLQKKIDEVLRHLNYELILVNDCSGDSSWQKIQAVAESNQSIVGINLRKNSGQDNALFAGLHYTHGDYVVIMDDDLQHDPEDILKLHHECKKGFDVCYANFTKKHHAWWKNVGSWFNGKISEIVINKPKHVYLSPYKMIKQAVVKEILLNNYLYPYIDGILFSITDNITQIEAIHNKRRYGESTYNLLESVAVFMKLATGFSIIPLRIASIVGLISSLLGFVFGFYLIILYIMSDFIIEGWTSTIVVVLFIGGLILLSLGIMGEYIGRIYLSINNKPRYSIKEIIKSV